MLSLRGGGGRLEADTHKRNDSGNGFTIIELIIVIVVIAILTTIVAVAYSGITRNAHISVLKSELASAQRQLQLDFAKNSEAYPDSLEDSNDGRGLQFNDKATLAYTAHNDEEPKRYCLTATIDTLTYYVVPSQAPQEGFCPEHNPNIAPDAPSISTTVDSQTQITVSWEAVGDPLTDNENQIAASYRLEYSTSADFTSFSTINNITNTSREVTGLSAGTTYYFRVYSINSNGSASAPSTVVSDETQQLPPAGAPTVTCTTNSATQITVNWTTVSGATSYTLEQSTASNFSPVTTIPDLTGSSTARTALNQGIRYYFRVSSTGPGGVGPTSSAVNCTTTINAPDSPTVTVTIPGGSRAASSGPWAKNLRRPSNLWYVLLCTRCCLKLYLSRWHEP